MLQYILGQIICNTFEQECERHQYKPEDHGKCLYVCFDLTLDYEKEEGYRWVELVIYAPCNYVAVFIREGKNIKTEFETNLDHGKWERLSYHDSCWRQDGVSKFISRYNDRFSLIGFNFNKKWYSIQDVPKEIAEGRLWDKRD